MPLTPDEFIRRYFDLEPVGFDEWYPIWVQVSASASADEATLNVLGLAGWTICMRAGRPELALSVASSLVEASSGSATALGYAEARTLQATANLCLGNIHEGVTLLQALLADQRWNAIHVAMGIRNRLYDYAMSMPSDAEVPSDLWGLAMDVYHRLGGEGVPSPSTFKELAIIMVPKPYKKPRKRPKR